VTKDISPNSMVAGCPVKVIKGMDKLKCPPGFFEKPYM